MRFSDIQIGADELARLCEEYSVQRLEVAGSFAAGGADSDSDLDLIVTFMPGGGSGLRMVALQQALEALCGRPVDLLARESVETSRNKYFRHYVLRQSEMVYERHGTTLAENL